MMKETRSQVSLEYLLTVLFAVLLAIAASVLALNLAAIADSARARMLEAREDAVASLVG